MIIFKILAVLLALILSLVIFLSTHIYVSHKIYKFSIFISFFVFSMLIAYIGSSIWLGLFSLTLIVTICLWKYSKISQSSTKANTFYLYCSIPFERKKIKIYLSLSYRHLKWIEKIPFLNKRPLSIKGFPSMKLGKLIGFVLSRGKGTHINVETKGVQLNFRIN